MNALYFCWFTCWGCLVWSKDPAPLVMPGHVTIGVLTQMRQDVNAENCTGPIKAWALQEVAVLEWALKTINNQTSHDFSVGLQVYDNCRNNDRLTRQTVTLLKGVQNRTNPLIGIISLGNLPSINTVVSLLHAYWLPLMTTQATSQATLNDENVFTTGPHFHAHMQAVLAVVSRQRRHTGILQRDRRLGIVSECPNALQILENMAEKRGVRVHSSIRIDPRNETKLAQDTAMFLKSQVGFQGTVILLLHATSMNRLIENIDPILVKRAESFWIFAVLDGEPDQNNLHLQKISESFHMSAIVEPFSPMLPGLRLHLRKSQTTNMSIISHLSDLVQSSEHCSNQNAINLKNCKQTKTFAMLSGTRATSAIKAISTLVAAFRLVQIDRCPNNDKCHKIFDEEIGKDMVQSLMKLSYSAQETSDPIRYTADGRFVTSFLISRVHASEMQQVGKYREDTGVVWTHPLTGMTSHAGKLDLIDGKDKTKTEMTEHFVKSENFDNFEEYTKDEGIIKQLLYSQPDRIGIFYALSVLVWASTGILSASYIAVYLVVKTWDGPISSSKMLESILLLGVIACFISCILFVIPPTLIMCRLRTMMPPISLSICFGVILLKTMQLRASQTLGVAGEVTKTNVCLTLIFIVGVQMALSVISQKDLLREKHSTPVVELGANGIRICRRETLPGLIMQEYLLIILVFSKVISLINRNATKGNVEDLRLLQVSGFSSVIILVWMGITILSQTCAVLIATCVICLILSTCILILIFAPKMFTIMKQERRFKHKQLAASTVSNIFKQTENVNCVQTLRPPPPFCDPPGLRGYKFYDMPPMRPWRLDPYDSPISHHSIPPPPPPPVKDHFFHRALQRGYSP